MLALSLFWRRRASICAGLLLCNAAAHAADVVTWTMPDFAPAILPVNGLPTKGVADQIGLYLKSQWPEVEHRFLYANIKRVWTDIGAGNKICHIGSLVTPERRRLAYFTLTHLAPPTMLIVRADTLAALPLNPDGDVKLLQLFAMPTLRGVVAEKRSFGNTIDGFIAERPQGGMAVVPPANFAGGLLKMLAAGQIDYTIEYDFALSYQQSQNSALQSLRAVAIEGAVTMMPVGIACPRTPWGKAAIEHIDRILATKEGANAMRQANDSWSTPATLQRFRKEVDQFTAKRMAPSNPASF